MEDEEEKAGPLSGKIQGSCHLQDPAVDDPRFALLFHGIRDCLAIRSNRRSTIVLRTMEEETIDLSFRKRSKKGKKERRFNNDPFYFFESIEEGTTFIVDEGITRPFSSSFFGIDLSTRDALSFLRFDIFDTIGL